MVRVGHRQAAFVFDMSLRLGSSYENLSQRFLSRDRDDEKSAHPR